MNPYPKPVYRVWFVCAAVALTALTFGIAIVVPAEYESGVTDIPMMAKALADARRIAAVEATIGAGAAALPPSKPGSIQRGGILPGREG